VPFSHETAKTALTTEEPAAVSVRLDMATIEILARRITELLSPRAASAPRERYPSGRLLSAAEVSEWWGVSRGWVYQHASELGAVRIGDGERPRLRFDPDRVAERLNQAPTAPPIDPSQRRGSGRRSPRIRRTSRRLAFQADPELSSLNSPSEAGRRAQRPRRGAKDQGFDAMTCLPPGQVGVARSEPRATHGLDRCRQRR
jgi:hypothetical protein